jgi:hypothetical protein
MPKGKEVEVGSSKTSCRRKCHNQETNAADEAWPKDNTTEEGKHPKEGWEDRKEG